MSALMCGICGGEIGPDITGRPACYDCLWNAKAWDGFPDHSWRQYLPKEARDKRESEWMRKFVENSK